MASGLLYLLLVLPPAALAGQAAAQEGRPPSSVGQAALVTPPADASVQPQQAAKDVEQKPVVPAATPPKPPPSKMSRWLEFQVGTVAARYRYLETSQGVVSSNQLQSSGQVRARVKVDSKGRLAVTTMFNTGNNFTGSWNNTGIGTGDAAGMWHMKQLYIGATPAKGIDVSFGGIAPTRGESTEITTYDNDAYLTGERLSVKRPKDLFFDEITVTSAYLGDTAKPGFTDRYRRLAEARNYYHYLVGKKVTANVGVSGDYTRHAGVGTVRFAATIRTVATRVMDLVRYEQYFRGGGKAASGFGIYGEKKVTRRLTAGFGYADIDLNYGGLNGDRFNKGRRVYETASFKVTPELTIQAWVGHAAWNDVAIANKHRVDLIASYNVLGAFQRYGVLR